MEIDIDALVAALRKVKQDEYNDAVEGNPSKPDEVVDSVCWALEDFIPDRRLYEDVINFYPDYTG